MRKSLGTAILGEGFNMLFFFSTLLSISVICSAVDTIGTTRMLNDDETIASSEGNFELGFFRPSNSSYRYVGIWYKNMPTQTVVWVANRETPLVDSSGVLKIISPGILAVLNSTNATIWSSNTPSRSANDPVAQLLDSGNLVVRDANDQNPENFMWQSFDYPSDTLLPGMKLGKNLATGHDCFLTSWKSNDDPAPGDFTFLTDATGYPQLVLKEGSMVQYSSGPWNGLRFSGTENLKSNYIYRFQLVYNDKEMYYSYEQVGSIFTRYVMNQTGIAQRWIWSGSQNQGWDIYNTRPTDICDNFDKCGANSVCNIANSPVCGCLSKFVSSGQLNNSDWSGGCARRTPLNCTKGDGFVKYSNLKWPDSRNSWFNVSLNLGECKRLCLRNCSCTAYSSLNITGGGSGCLHWFGDLHDIRMLSENGQDLYIRMASSELGGFSGKKRQQVIIISSALVMGMLLLVLCFALFVLIKKKNSQLTTTEKRIHNFEQGYLNESQNKDLELPIFDFATLADATNNFSGHNKLGEGGFGPVYKGVLEEGQEIAVKRLSRNSSQGLDEFKNEVIYIAKLQHRNLVRLLGCCIQGEEKMLVYEYMPNSSLDTIIFDQARSTLLDWPKRFNIINGIARGLLYLHQDSRLKIIHRDLKASNILLDIDMNPKISDFGGARCFGEHEIEGTTERVVGTYGYMSPEYAVDGLFSVKSDVFSFGVLILEIVSGRRNRGFINPYHRLNLVGHAWRLLNEGRVFELIDAPSQGFYNLSQVQRSVHVGLLCVQQYPDDRPDMSSVVLMLRSEVALAQPKEPGFFTERSFIDASWLLSNHATSVNEMTITQLEAR